MAWVEGSCPREAFRRGIMNVQREFLQRNIPENWAAFAATNFYSRFWPGKVAVHSSLQLFSLLAPLLSRIVSPPNIIIHISRYNKKKKVVSPVKKKRAVGRIYAKRVLNAIVTISSLFASKFLWNEGMIIIRRKSFERYRISIAEKILQFFKPFDLQYMCNIYINNAYF